MYCFIYFYVYYAHFMIVFCCVLPASNKARDVDDDVFHMLIITGRICRRQICRYCFYSRAYFGFFRPAGATRCPDQGQIWHGGADRSSVPNFTLIGSGVGVYGPQNWKNWNFTNIIAPTGRVPCTIFTKFISFMRVLSLH